MAMKRACTFLDKGGVGKTTTAAHLGVALAQQGEDVLLVDLAGKQNDLAKHFGLYETVQQHVEDGDDWPNISTVFEDSWDRITEKLGDAAVTGMILETDEGPDLIPAHEGLDSVDDKITSIPAPDRYDLFNDFLTEDVAPLGYDMVLVDLPGNTGNVALNGIFAMENIIVPAEPGEFEDNQIQQLEDDIETYNEEFEDVDGFEVDLRMAMVMPNKIDERTKMGRQAPDEFRESYPETVSPAHVPISQSIKNAQGRGETVFAVASDERSSTAERTVKAYRENAQALLSRLGREVVA